MRTALHNRAWRLSEGQKAAMGYRVLSRYSLRPYELQGVPSSTVGGDSDGHPLMRIEPRRPK